MRRIHPLAFVLATPLLAACDSPTAHDGPGAKPGFTVAPPEARPLRGSCEITSTQLLSFQPPILRQSSSALCHVSLLGRVSVATVQEINVATGSQVAEATWTTASGEALYATSVGVANPTGPTTIEFSGVTTLSGGTGRFANAAGSVDVAGSADNATGTGSFTYHGWLSYRASDRSGR